MFSNFMQAFSGAQPGMPRSKNNYGKQDKSPSVGFTPGGMSARTPGGFNFNFGMGNGSGMSGGDMGMRRPMMPQFDPSQFMMQQQQQQPMQMPDYMQGRPPGDMSGMSGGLGDMYRQGKIQTMGPMGGGMLSNYFNRSFNI